MTCTKFFRTHLASPASFNVVHENATIMLEVNIMHEVNFLVHLSTPELSY